MNQPAYRAFLRWLADTMFDRQLDPPLSIHTTLGGDRVEIAVPADRLGFWRGPLIEAALGPSAEWTDTTVPDRCQRHSVLAKVAVGRQHIVNIEVFAMVERERVAG